MRRPIGLETLLYKFYKNWEKHQKRHYRGRSVEEYIIKFLEGRGYIAGKVKVRCEGKEGKMDCTIPLTPPIHMSL